jgi:hypothetical protein
LPVALSYRSAPAIHNLLSTVWLCARRCSTARSSSSATIRALSAPARITFAHLLVTAGHSSERAPISLFSAVRILPTIVTAGEIGANVARNGLQRSFRPSRFSVDRASALTTDNSTTPACTISAASAAAFAARSSGVPFMDFRGRRACARRETLNGNLTTLLMTAPLRFQWGWRRRERAANASPARRPFREYRRKKPSRAIGRGYGKNPGRPFARRPDLNRPLVRPAICQRAFGCRFVNLPTFPNIASAQEFDDLLRSSERCTARVPERQPFHLGAFFGLVFGRSSSWRAMHASSLGHLD